MKTFLKIAALALSLFSAAPTIAQVRWGVDLHFGSPSPRREIIAPCPYPGGTWEPGYYNHYGRRYIWVPGRWRRPVYIAPPPRYGWNRDWHRNWYENRHWKNDHDDRGHGEFRHGRIR
jgi:hypothetical protein